MPVEGAPVEWMTWVDRWFATSTLTPEARREYRSILAKTGRWLTSDQPHIATPADWTRDTCAAWVARVTRIGIGDYAQRRVGLVGRLGRRLAPTSMASYISATRTLLRDCQEWGWCPRRFDPATALATPRSVRAMLGPKPRVIADDIWAKILWAGLNLEADDLAGAGIRAYPLELVRALTLTWLFAGQRSDEILRLRVGCIRWQHSDGTDPGVTGMPARYPRPQDRHGIHQAGRSPSWPPHRSVAGGASNAAADDRPQDRRGNRSSFRRSRQPRCPDIHQRDDHSDALPQGRCVAKRMHAVASPVTAPVRRSPVSSTTPRNR